MSAVTIQPPLSRRGHGPGLIIVVEEGINLSKHDKILDPPPSQKWAEEGYAVAQITVAPGAADVAGQVTSAIESLRELDSCDEKDKFGVICKDIVAYWKPPTNKSHQLSSVPPLRNFSTPWRVIPRSRRPYFTTLARHSQFPPFRIFPKP